MASDEPNYIRAADRHARWIAGWLREGRVEGKPPFDPLVLKSHWDADPLRVPHPPFSRELSALAAALAPEGTHTLVAHRLHLAVLGGLLLLVVAVGATRMVGMRAASAAVASLVAMPQLVGMAHVGLTDFPLAVLWTGAVVASASARGSYLSRGTWAGIWVGCALATKLPAVFLVPVLGGWLLWHRRADGLRQAVVTMTVALAVAVALNPNGWVEPAEKLRTWITLSTTRKDFHPIRSYYFGQTYSFHPPWHYPWVELVATTPLGVLGLAILGAVTGLGRGSSWRAEAALVLAASLVLPAVLTWPGSPCHDGIRLFLPTLPLLAMFAGYGCETVGMWLSERVRARSVSTAVVALESKLVAAVAMMGIGPGLIATVATHPYSMAYYGGAVGGVSGADRLGLETTYLKEVMTPKFVEMLNRRLPRGSIILTGFTYEELAFDQETGDLDRSFRLTDFAPADFFVMVHRKGELSDFGWHIHRNIQPLFRLSLSGVPLVSLYRVSPNPPTSTATSAPD